MGNLNKNQANCHNSIKGSTLEDHYPQELKSPLTDQIYFVKLVPLNVKIYLIENIFWSEVRKVGF